jgi:hypothetical protein
MVRERIAGLATLATPCHYTRASNLPLVSAAVSVVARWLAEKDEFSRKTPP